MAKVAIRFTAFCRKVLLFPLTKGQTAFCRVCFDGDDPIDIEDPELREIALQMFGGVERIPARARRRIVERCGRNSGKTRIAAALGLYIAVVADLSAYMVGGDEPTVLVVSTKRGTGKHGGGGSGAEVVKAALAFAQNNAALAGAIKNPNTEGFAIELPGRPRVRFITAAKGKGGKNVRSISIIGLILDESEFIGVDDPDAGGNDRVIVAAARARMAPGAPVLLMSTPWPVPSLTSELFDANYGEPKDALACLAPTLVMRDNDPHLVELREEQMQEDLATALREWDCITTDVGGMFFEASSIDAAVRPPEELRLMHSGKTSAGMDLGFSKNSSSLVVLERQDDLVVAVKVRVDTPKQGHPLKPSVVCGEYAQEMHAHGSRAVVVDAHYIESVREAATSIDPKFRIEIMSWSSGTASKAFERLRRLFRERRILIPAGPMVNRLKSVMKREQPGGGYRIVLPGANTSNHCDDVAALANAAWLDRRFGDPARKQEKEPKPMRGPVPFQGMTQPRPEEQRQAVGSAYVRGNPFVIASGFTKY